LRLGDTMNELARSKKRSPSSALATRATAEQTVLGRCVRK
jgi:hypothetical protein